MKDYRTGCRKLARISIPMVLAITAACSDSGEESGDPDGSNLAGQISLDDELDSDPAKAGTSGSSKAVQDPNEAEAREVQHASGGTSDVQAVPASGGQREAVKAINRWHRAVPAQRPSVLAGMQAGHAQALRDFGAIWDGRAAAYEAALRLELPEGLGPDFQRYAQALAEGGVSSLATALRGGRGPSWMAWQEALAIRASEKEEHATSCLALGALLRRMMEEGYERDRILSLRNDVLSVSRYASDFVPFDLYSVESGDSLIRIANKHRKGGVGVRYGWIQRFNDKASDQIRVGEELRIPQTSLHVEVWRSLRVAAIYSGEYIVRLYPVSVGRRGADETPLGVYTVEIHDPEPIWYRKDGPNLPYGNPENPLGEAWLGFKEKPSYGLHGTNSEDTIGTYETQGCIRFHNVDIEEVYDLLPVGSKVQIHG